jgi:hypothetical protein
MGGDRRTRSRQAMSLPAVAMQHVYAKNSDCRSGLEKSGRAGYPLDSPRLCDLPPMARREERLLRVAERAAAKNPSRSRG